MFQLESPHQGDSNEYTQHIIINMKKENHPKLSTTKMSAAVGFFVRD